MTQPKFDDDDEKPLDPAVEKVRRRLVRFMAINLGLLFLAVMAVLVAIVYKARTPPIASAAVETALELPAGATVRGHDLSGDRLSLQIVLPDGSRSIYIYDIAARRVIARIALTVQP